MFKYFYSYVIKYSSIFVIAIVTSNQVAVPVDVAYLKDTYSILSDNYKHCSPLHGAVWIETNLLKKYYKYFAEDNLKKPEHSTIKLIQSLFHLIGDSFSITRDKGMPAHYFSPQMIGLIIGTIEKTTQANKKTLSKNIETLINTNQHFIQQVQAQFNQTTPIKNQERIIKDRVKQLAKAIEGSLDECGFWDANDPLRHYPLHMTHAILLGFLYKVSNNKQDMKNYFTAVNAVITSGVFTIQGNAVFAAQGWPVSIFDKTKADQIIAVSSSFPATKPSQQMFSLFLQNVAHQIKGTDPFEAIVFAEITKQFYSKSLPQVIGNRKNNIYFEGQRPFSDCTEIVLRNLCNFLLFNQEELKFIPQKIASLHPSPELISYYQADRADATKHLQSDTYQTWGNLLQNIPGVIYAAMASHDFKIRYERLLGDTIFIQQKAWPCYVVLAPADLLALKIPPLSGHSYNFTIGGEHYIIANASHYKTYALWPSLKNIIILLNRLFNLELYSDHLAPFKDPQFCSKYFPLLCQKLGWKYIMPQGIYLDTPYLYWNHTIRMELINDSRVSWDLFVKWHHVEVKNPQTPPLQAISKKYRENLFNGLLACKESMSVCTLLALYALKDNQQTKDAANNLLKNDTVVNRFILYAQDIDSVANNLSPNTPEEKALKRAQGDNDGDSVLKLQMEKLQKKLNQLKQMFTLLKNKQKNLISALKKQA